MGDVLGTEQHPLDAYFLHRIRLERHEHIKQQQRLRNHKHSTKMTVEEAVERDEQVGYSTVSVGQ